MGKKALVTAKSGDLTVIEPIQRRLNANRVRKLATEWDGSLIGTLEVAEIEYDGKLVWHIVDGQHRWEAAKIAEPDREFTCVVEYDLTQEQVAKLFLARNQKNAKVPALDQYEVGIFAKDPIALAVRTGMNKASVKAGTTPDETHVAAIAAMMAVVKKGNKVKKGQGSKLLATTLMVVKAAWPENTGSRFNGDIIKGAGFLIANHWGVIDLDRLTAKMSERTPEQWTTDAKAMNNAMSGGGSEGRANLLQRMFRQAYDHRLRKASKLA